MKDTFALDTLLRRITERAVAVAQKRLRIAGVAGFYAFAVFLAGIIWKRAAILPGAIYAIAMDGILGHGHIFTGIVFDLAVCPSAIDAFASGRIRGLVRIFTGSVLPL